MADDPFVTPRGGIGADVGRCILAIDPGATSGAWAALYPSGKLMVGDLPVVDGNVDASQFGRLVRLLNPARAIMEQVGPMPKQGVSSTFKFGKGCGRIEGVLAGADVSITTVTPQKWKRAFPGLASLEKKAAKERARLLVKQRWPSLTDFNRVKDAGRAEAALMALWGGANT